MSSEATSSNNLKRKRSRHYLADLLIFQVEDHLFRIPVDVLRGSPYFADMLEAENTGLSQEGVSEDHPILLKGIKAEEMEGFLDLLLARSVERRPSLTMEQAAAALHLATMWSFDRVRTLAIRRVDALIPSQDQFDVLELAWKCNVHKWQLPAYLVLCGRPDPLSKEEASRLGFARLTAICRVREKRLASTYPARLRCGHCNRCRGSKTCNNPPAEGYTANLESLIRAEPDLGVGTEQPLEILRGLSDSEYD